VTAPQAVFTVAAAAVAVSIALVVAGVAVLAGPGWALVAAGALVGPCTVGAAAVLLRDGGETG